MRLSDGRRVVIMKTLVPVMLPARLFWRTV